MLDIRYFHIPSRLAPFIERAIMIDFTHSLGVTWQALPLGCHNVSVLSGPETREYELENPEDDGSFCGIAPRLMDAYCERPCLGFGLGLTPLGVLHLPLHTHDFESSFTLPSEAIFGRTRWLDLRRRVRDAVTPQDKMHTFMTWMEAQLMGKAVSHGRAVSIAEAAMLMRAPRPPSIVDAAARSGVHRRQFERDFRRFLGTSPKKYATVARVQQVMQLSWQGVGLAGIAAELSFTDQAHMNHVVKDFTGLSPAALLRRAATSPLARATRPFTGGRITHL